MFAVDLYMRQFWIMWRAEVDFTVFYVAAFLKIQDGKRNGVGANANFEFLYTLCPEDSKNI